jgi:hypothetical protein
MKTFDQPVSASIYQISRSAQAIEKEQSSSVLMLSPFFLPEYNGECEMQLKRQKNFNVVFIRRDG